MIKNKLEKIFNGYDKSDDLAIIDITNDMDCLLDDCDLVTDYNIEYTDKVVVVAWKEPRLDIEIAVFEL